MNYCAWSKGWFGKCEWDGQSQRKRQRQKLCARGREARDPRRGNFSLVGVAGNVLRGRSIETTWKQVEANDRGACRHKTQGGLNYVTVFSSCTHDTISSILYSFLSKLVFASFAQARPVSYLSSSWVLIKKKGRWSKKYKTNETINCVEHFVIFRRPIYLVVQVFERSMRKK